MALASSSKDFHEAKGGSACLTLASTVRRERWLPDAVSATQGQAPVQARGPSWSSPAAPAGCDGIIVELFGPAACGKTTLGRALERALADRGVAVRLVTSSRPAEKDPKEARVAAAMAAPLSRISKLFTAIGALMPGVSTEPLVGQLMETMPPRSWTRALRARRYLRNLGRSWEAALSSDDVVIFDQGFMNSLCSLALCSGLIDRDSLARGLSLLPAPDLLIRVDTPREVLRMRLQRRLRRQTTVERWFERDIETALRQFELLSCLDDLLASCGRHSLPVSWRDGDSLSTAVRAITDEIVWRKEGRA